MLAFHLNARDEFDVNVPGIFALIEQFHMPFTSVEPFVEPVVEPFAVPIYDQTPLVSSVEKSKLVLVYVSCPGIGVLCIPSITTVIGSDVSGAARMSEAVEAKTGVTVNEYFVPFPNPLNVALLALPPTLKVCATDDAMIPEIVKLSICTQWSIG